MPPIIPLFYGLPVSDAQLIKEEFLGLPSLVAILFSFINLLIIRFTKDKFLERIFSGLIVATTIFACITVIKIIFLVGSFS
jgi:hypothetical protein